MPFIPTHRQKLALHIVQLILVHIAIGLSVPRLFMKTKQPRTRANTIAMGMGAKSIMFIFYQILTENVKAFKKFASFKANMIINCAEIVFWGAVVFLVIQANISRCTGITCILSWITVGVAIVITIVQVPLAYFSIVEFREGRKVGDNGRNGGGRRRASAAAGRRSSRDAGYSYGYDSARRDEEMVEK